MLPRFVCIAVLLLSFSSCDTFSPAEEKLLGQFDVNNDLLLAQFDSKTDVDDIHAIAAVRTILSDPRLNGVRFHAVAGAYGTQGGQYIPANELFDAAFGKNWSDAHTDFAHAASEVADIATKTLGRGGDIWIAEAGQSDFSAAVIKSIQIRVPHIDTKKRIHIVQHSEWNENNTAPANLQFVKANTAYNKIPDGNAIGNGTPGLRVNKRFNWQTYITDPALKQVWEMAVQIANKHNATPGRYNNTHIRNGGMDFSDAAETCWIFGFEHLADPEAFFKEFAN